jgi:DNA-binding transcriptional LysR family regulator
MDTHTAMATFAKVVELGSFAAAADKLQQARSVVTRQVAYLEEKYGARLLNRTTRKLSLTDAGQAFYDRVRPIINEMQELEEALRNDGGTPTGRLRVSAPVSFGILHLGPIVSDFLDKYPDIMIDLDLNDRVVDLVEEGFDVAIRIGTLQESSLVARALAPQELVLCAAPAYLARHGMPRNPDDLKQHRCLHYAYFSSGSEWRFDKDGQSWNVRVPVSLRANNGDILCAAAMAGQGVILEPTFLVEQALQDGRLVRLLPDYSRPAIKMYAVYPHRRHLSAKVRSFVDHLERYFTAECEERKSGRKRQPVESPT